MDLATVPRKSSRCCRCARRIDKARYPESEKAAQARRFLKKQAAPIAELLAYAASRARKKGIEFSISEKDVTVPDLCPLLEIPLRSGNPAEKNNSPSIDRIDNSKGYVPGNVRVISNLANVMKHTASHEQLLLFAKNITAYLAS